MVSFQQLIFSILYFCCHVIQLQLLQLSSFDNSILWLNNEFWSAVKRALLIRAKISRVKTIGSAPAIAVADVVGVSNTFAAFRRFGMLRIYN
jgi:hypothetical protein